MLVVMYKSTYKEHLSQPLQTNNKHVKVAVTFLTGFNGISNVTDKNNIFYFTKSITDEDGFVQIHIPTGSYKIKCLNIEIKRFIIDEGHFTETNYAFQIKPNFSTLGTIIEISTQGPLITFYPRIVYEIC